MAAALSQRAVSLGVSPDHILVEDKSDSTFTNAKYSLKIVQDRGFMSALIVTSNYHTRRSSIIFHQVFRGIDLTICAVPDRSSTYTEQHIRSELSIMTSEYLKLVWHYLFER